MISPITSTAVRPAAAPEAAERPQAAQSAPFSGSPRPVRDEYIPEEKRKAGCGRYWLEKSRDGSLKVHFDAPEAAENPGKDPAASGEKEPEAAAPEEESPEKAAPSGGGRKAERCTGNTDKVDRELEKLRKKRAELEKQLASETDEVKARDLERKLAQVENELRQKDNDAYRRRHSVFTEG